MGKKKSGSSVMGNYLAEERAEISWHECKIFLAIPEGKWLTSKEISKLSKIPARTCRMHLLRFCRLGLIDLAEVFPAHRYRLSDKAHRRNHAYLNRIQKALEVFGLNQ